MRPEKILSINELIWEISDLQEEWDTDPASFNWESLENVAKKGARAYNEGAGPSFHALGKH
jgi:hypothetical protein